MKRDGFKLLYQPSDQKPNLLEKEPKKCTVKSYGRQIEEMQHIRLTVSTPVGLQPTVDGQEALCSAEFHVPGEASLRLTFRHKKKKDIEEPRNGAAVVVEYR